ncbi:EcsC family protein [Flexivirga meconopsidis]|uniref:EcsC family protein n=1 Tax=Flexivirga meconopsidis TaxID=2977121 RepID=UPI00223F6554|nr:EcsC family protein [Flexivirga meconopsidis]
MFGSKKSQQPAPLDSGPLGGTALSLAQHLLTVGIDGKAGFDSAEEIAKTAVRDHPGDPERAIDAIVSQHRKLAGAAGFVTGLGGFVTMIVALPANVLGFYVLSTRMSAAIAAVRGYDLKDETTRTALLLTLVGADSDDLLKKAGVVSTGRLANLATRQLPPTALMVVNKAVGFRLISQVSDKLLTKLGKGIPFAGGVIGAGLDAFLISRTAKVAKKEFPPATAALPQGR